MPWQSMTPPTHTLAVNDPQHIPWQSMTPQHIPWQSMTPKTHTLAVEGPKIEKPN